ncbi:MFS transporter [Crenobacter intestini]|uniref:MFS transporter n=1 Tax=Crenobacter intestini TaxID=2563443 RepID=A0A4T0UUN6_9NEIS|nr:MFS transporter [Crenobacter intestini]TIC82386.1 MFS transporter [Crenobacter intestini]
MENPSTGLARFLPLSLQGKLAWWLAVLFLLYQFNIQTTYSVINPHVQHTLALSLSQVTLAASAYNWVYAVCQTMSGSFLDKYGTRRTLLLPIALVVAGVFCYARADSFIELLAAQVLLAVGASVSFVSAGFIGGVWFGQKKYGLLFGYVQALAGLSSALSITFIKQAVEQAGWRSVLLLAGCAGLILYLLFLMLFRDPPPHYSDFSSGGSGKLLDDLLQIVTRHRDILLLGLWGGIAFGSQLALGVVWVPKIAAWQGQDTATGGYAVAALWLGLGVGALFWDRLGYHRAQKKGIISLGFAVMIVSLALMLLPLGQGQYWLIVLSFVFGFGNGVHMLAFSCAADKVPSSILGSASALINAAFFIIGGVLISLPSLLVEYTGTGMQTALFSLVLALGLAQCLVLTVDAATRPPSTPGPTTSAR